MHKGREQRIPTLPCWVSLLQAVSPLCVKFFLLQAMKDEQILALPLLVSGLERKMIVFAAALRMAVLQENCRSKCLSNWPPSRGI
jgi:hypothetical protein